VPVSGVVLGKYLGLLGYFLILLVVTSLTPLALSLGTRLDYGLLAAGMTGLLLLALGCSAIGVFASTLTRQPAIAAALAFCISFMFWIMHVLGSTGNERLAALINYLSMQRHFNQFLSGLVNSVDVVYFLLLSTLFILLGILRLDALRRLD
jgi:ABC-2 type transport system permease protein